MFVADISALPRMGLKTSRAQGCCYCCVSHYRLKPMKSWVASNGSQVKLQTQKRWFILTGRWQMSHTLCLLCRFSFTLSRLFHFPSQAHYPPSFVPLSVCHQCALGRFSRSWSLQKEWLCLIVVRKRKH